MRTSRTHAENKDVAHAVDDEKYHQFWSCYRGVSSIKIKWSKHIIVEAFSVLIPTFIRPHTTSARVSAKLCIINGCQDMNVQGLSHTKRMRRDRKEYRRMRECFYGFLWAISSLVGPFTTINHTKLNETQTGHETTQTRTQKLSYTTPDFINF